MAQAKKGTALTNVITLSDGSIVTLRPATGGDFEKGSAVTGGSNNPITMMFGLISQVATISGKPLIYEEIQALPFADAMELVGAVAGNVRSPALGIFSS
jgi:hypothetical protein